MLEHVLGRHLCRLGRYHIDKDNIYATRSLTRVKGN